MGTPESSSEPCPDRILDDIGGAFCMGALGGSLFYLIKGAVNSPKGERILGGVQSMRMKAPRISGGFAVWGGLFSSFDCVMAFARQKEDPWNSILSAAAAGALLQMRHGLRASAKGGVFSAALIGGFEGMAIMIDRYLPDELNPPPASKGGGFPGNTGFGFPGNVGGGGKKDGSGSRRGGGSGSGSGSEVGEF